MPGQSAAVLSYKALTKDSEDPLAYEHGKLEGEVNWPIISSMIQLYQQNPNDDLPKVQKPSAPISKNPIVQEHPKSGMLLTLTSEDAESVPEIYILSKTTLPISRRRITRSFLKQPSKIRRILISNYPSNLINRQIFSL